MTLQTQGPLLAYKVVVLFSFMLEGVLMRTSMRPTGSFLRCAVFVAALAAFAVPAVFAGDTAGQQVANLDNWRAGLSQAESGDFSKAAETIKQIPGDNDLVARVRTWLDEYQAAEGKRKTLDKDDYERYVRYAKERVERKEYTLALDQALRAADVASHRDELLKSDWMVKLVNDSLEEAAQLREKGEWRKAWHIYADLGALYDREPRYQKLESEVLTHLRLDAMFDEKSHWEEEIEHVQWRDAENALELIGLAYVEEPDFKKITERGLEQLLLMAESKTARKEFEGLANDHNRHDFEARIKANLEQVRAEPAIDRSECVRRFRRAVRRINEETVRLPEELIVSELMRGALEPLDEFTTVIWPSDTDDFDKHTRGDFVGVGISIIKNRAGEIEVVTPLEDTPAFYSGVQAGDIITHVDGAELKDVSLNKVVDTITGPMDTRVTLSIRRADKVLEFPLTRTKVKIQSVKGWKREKDSHWDHWLDKDAGIAYVRLTNFAKNTYEDLANSLSELRPNGMKGLVLDLRWNPGGLLDSAWQVSSLFLNRGDVVVSTKGRNHGDDQRLPVSSDGAFSDLPIVILVNESSASASEIVSGAIRDNHRGTVIGERTFGKFSVQNLIPLSSSEAKLKITTARYYLPSGASLHREVESETWGVDPDVPIRLGRWEGFNAWQLRREADLLGPPKPVEEKDADAADAEDADEDGEETADASDEPKLPPLEQPDENNRPKADPQVDTALLLLRMKLLAEKYPTLATALGQAPDKSEKETAKR
jgi:carboxyl-terminal processing protease